MCEKMKINEVEKLVPNLHDKKNYFVYTKALNQALKVGLILEKTQVWLSLTKYMAEPFKNFNTQLRSQTKNDFEKDFFKLMNNSVFGKTMENIRKHEDIKLATNKESFLKTVMKPNFKSEICFGPSLIGCEMGEIKVLLNKPVYLGQATLDLSKLALYKFDYD